MGPGMMRAYLPSAPAPRGFARRAHAPPFASELGSLDQVAQILKVVGMVNTAPGFVLMAPVLDGCTNQLAEVFGDAGIPARVAVGMALPMDVAVETEMTVALHG
jgi:enamine deaminase RidA (YjgF/YER057c/UK114 family)